MTELDFDMFRKTQWLTGVTPDSFEIVCTLVTFMWIRVLKWHFMVFKVLMVDADTRVHPASISKLLNAMHNDPEIMGACGETRIANKFAGFTTAIQVYEVRNVCQGWLINLSAQTTLNY
jgi:chitin synthase